MTRMVLPLGMWAQWALGLGMPTRRHFSVQMAHDLGECLRTCLLGRRRSTYIQHVTGASEVPDMMRYSHSMLGREPLVTLACVRAG